MANQIGSAERARRLGKCLDERSKLGQTPTLGISDRRRNPFVNRHVLTEGLRPSDSPHALRRVAAA